MPDSTPKAAAKSTAKNTDPHEVGYFGNSPKSIPNSEFSLQTGPDSPSAASQIVDARRAQLVDAEASLTNDDPKKG